MLANIQRLQYDVPTPVQKHAIPIYLMRRDLMACAQTGSGKTAAYLFPLCAKMLKDGPPPPARNRIAMPVSLLLSPTRELAI
jgi:ATP-dependent RNA helicase DDX3X